MQLRSVLIIVMTIPYAMAQGHERAPFESRMYAIERLDVPRPQQFANLNAGERRALVTCRDTLVAVFKGITANTSLRPYLTPDLARKYPTTESLAADLIERETSLLAIGVSEFRFIDVSEIRLKLLALVFAEGGTFASSKVAYCRRSGDQWRISGFE